MAEPEDDKLQSIAVVSDGKPPSVATVRSDGELDDRENKQAVNPEGFVQENEKRVKFDSVDLDDFSASEYTDDDGDDEGDDDSIFKDSKQRRKRLKKKKPKHVVIEDDSSSDDDKQAVNTNSDLTWLLWMWYYVRAVSSGALKAAEFLGEKLASFFGITTPKYQYVIDEYYRLKELEREEEEKELKEQEFVTQRKMEELSKMEGGDPELVYDEVSSATAPHAAVS
ncbi:protein FAM177A1-like isoform X2 [Dendronephthya gigantea]|uniref:protein FAM177A1-like isoform X2 n=1 Tax=Dendronephthya gigantea TaxID=151771 RepID=UPI00106D2DA3|nr:protein FAM177A1-like isoform X2 [Dendronephthya gigantea]